MRIGTRANPQPVADKANALDSRVRQTCSIVQSNVQKTVCDITANQCPGLEVKCGNAAKQQLSCNLEIIKGTVADMLQGEDPAALSSVLQLPPNSDMETITQYVMNYIDQQCFTSQNSDQSIYVKFVCNGAKNVGANIMNLLDQNSSCSIGYVAGTIQQARFQAAKTYNAKQQQRILAVALAIVIGTIFLAILIGVAISSSQSCRHIRVPK